MSIPIFKNLLDIAASALLEKYGFKKFDNLRRLLRAGEDNKDVPDMDLWLIPANKYDDIPKGYPVTDIFGETTPFKGKKTCCKNDVRCGVLPIGVLRPANDTATERVSFVLSRTVLYGGKIYEAGTECTNSALLVAAKQCK